MDAKARCRGLYRLGRRRGIGGDNEVQGEVEGLVESRVGACLCLCHCLCRCMRDEEEEGVE